MPKQEQFDLLLKNTLDGAVVGKTLPSDTFQKIRHRIETEKEKESRCFWQQANGWFNQKHILAVAACCFCLILGGIMLFSSPFNRCNATDAAEIVNEVMGNRYPVIDKNPGGNGLGLSYQIVDYSATDVSEIIGYPVRFPRILRGREREYWFKTCNIVGSNEATRFYTKGIYDRGLILVISIRPIEEKLAMRYQVNGREVFWSEKPVEMWKRDGSLMKLSKNMVNHHLFWEQNGLYYMLLDTQFNLNLEEALRIAAGVMGE